jgi:putative transposase
MGIKERTMKDTLGPKDHAEAVALFRAQVLGSMLSRELCRGERAVVLRELSAQRFRPPGSEVTRQYGVSTLERWLYAYRARGLAGLRPQLRSDRGVAQGLTDTQRQLICDIRRDHPGASASLILRTLVAEGRVCAGVVSANTVRRLLRDRGLDRVSLKHGAPGGRRRRWQCERPSQLWHGDVCHGASLRIDGRAVPLRIHAMLDDASRYIVAIRALSSEREADMLALMVDTARRFGLPETLYLDNGSTYSGEVLATACARLEVKLTHARPYDPQARGKMERFWRTLREGCLDHIGEQSSLHDVQVRLLAFCDKHYHVTPHSALLGKTPAQVWATRIQRDVAEAALRDALTVRGTRRVRRDGTMSIAGIDWELDAGYLAGRKVIIARTLAEVTEPPWVEYDGKCLPLVRVDAQKNALRPGRRPRTARGIDAVPFDPAGALLQTLVHPSRHRKEQG